MLAVIFELRIDWYTNKDKCSSTLNDMIDSDIPIVAQRDNIGSVHKNANIKITSLYANGTVLNY